MGCLIAADLVPSHWQSGLGLSVPAEVGGEQQALLVCPYFFGFSQPES